MEERHIYPGQRSGSGDCACAKREAQKIAKNFSESEDEMCSNLLLQNQNQKMLLISRGNNIGHFNCTASSIYF